VAVPEISERLTSKGRNEYMSLKLHSLNSAFLSYLNLVEPKKGFALIPRH